MMTVDIALDRLIHRRSCRAAFLAGNGVPGLSDAHLSDLGSIDARALNELGARVATDRARRHGEAKSRRSHPQTIDAFRARPAPGDGDALQELAFAFMESPAFDAYREVPHAGRGLSLEEAFLPLRRGRRHRRPGRSGNEFLAAWPSPVREPPRRPRPASRNCRTGGAITPWAGAGPPRCTAPGGAAS
jgi:hypothetical protein